MIQTIERVYLTPVQIADATSKQSVLIPGDVVH